MLTYSSDQYGECWISSVYGWKLIFIVLMLSHTREGQFQQLKLHHNRTLNKVTWLYIINVTRLVLECSQCLNLSGKVMFRHVGNFGQFCLRNVPLCNAFSLFTSSFFFNFYTPGKHMHGLIKNQKSHSIGKMQVYHICFLAINCSPSCQKSFFLDKTYATARISSPWLFRCSLQMDTIHHLRLQSLVFPIPEINLNNWLTVNRWEHFIERNLCLYYYLLQAPFFPSGPAPCSFL